MNIKRIYSLLFVIFILISFTSCSTGGYTISRLDEEGIDLTYENNSVRVDFLKDKEPPEQNTTASQLINVKDLGAVGDGIKNDTKACQKALNMVNQGGTVYFPAGTYLISMQLFIYGDNVTIKGDGNATKLIYKREQKTIDSVQDISLFGGRNGITNISVKDMYMEYQGNFFPELGQSYDGKINALYFYDIHDLLVENVEITGFNSSAVNIAGKADAYATDITVRDSYFHHNRVSGVLYGYVDGMLICNNIMEYQGSKQDGGTGYGSAGLGGSVPKNIRILNNECNYNYRKGIDLHAGENVIIEGNTCKANRLYGIYVEGPDTNHVIIKNNYVSDMDCEQLDVKFSYNWTMGITIGTYENDPSKFYDFQVIGNVIEDYGLGDGSSYAIYGYFRFSKGKVVIKDNIIKCNKTNNFILFNSDGIYAENPDANFIIEGNQMYAKKLTDHGVKIPKFESLIFTNNIIHIEDQFSGNPVYLQADSKSHSAIINLNNIICNNLVKNPIVIGNKVEKDSLVFENNIFNGKNYNNVFK